MVPEHGKQQKRSSQPSNSEGDADGSFVFEAKEAWKDFHNSLRQFYENGELCDVTLKVSDAVNIVTQQLLLFLILSLLFFSQGWEQTDTMSQTSSGLRGAVLPCHVPLRYGRGQTGLD